MDLGGVDLGGVSLRGGDLRDSGRQSVARRYAVVPRLSARLPVLCSTVLEPDLNLSLRQTDLLGDVQLALYRDEGAFDVLLFQFHLLLLRINRSILFAGSRFSCKD